MAFDYKKEYKEFYMPPKKPTIVEVPEMNFLAVRGCGNPNEEGGAYQAAVGLLYAVAYTIKMSYKGEHKIDGILRICGAAPGRILVAEGCARRGLQQ